MTKSRRGKETTRAESAKPARKVSGQTIFLIAAVVISCLVVGYVAIVMDHGQDGRAQAGDSKLRLEDIPFDGARAYEYLRQICAIGPRRSGSKGMEAQQKLLAEHFRKLGGQVKLQKFDVRHPVDGSKVPMANLIVQWHPERKERILLCAHYDTLPLPMLDPVNPRGTFIGANDGGSGVAVLMELAHHMPDFESPYGVDFALFDGEEFIFRVDHPYFRGSGYFAADYRRQRLPYQYRWGVLLDMIGDKDLDIYEEGHSMSWPDTRPLVEEIWATARRLGVREFVPRVKHTILDDHLPLRNTAGIPTCDIIDYDYPPWHTQGDTLDKCSALSLAKVGWVIHEWLKSLKVSGE